jgi:hypothetical protein
MIQPHWWPTIDAYVCFIVCDIQSDLYCMIKYLIIIPLSSINDDRFYIYVHRSLEDTLNMNMNMNMNTINSSNKNLN